MIKMWLNFRQITFTKWKYGQLKDAFIYEYQERHVFDIAIENVFIFGHRKSETANELNWKSRILNGIGRNKINSHHFALQITLWNIYKFSFKHVLTYF